MIWFDRRSFPASLFRLADDDLMIREECVNPASAPRTRIRSYRAADRNTFPAAGPA